MHYSHILVTTDFSDASKRAFEYAAYQAKMEGSKLSLISVIADWEVPVSFYPYISSPERIEEYRQSLLTQAKKQLEEFAVGLFHSQKVETHVVLSIKAVSDEIVDYAATHECDLIVMASHGKGAVTSLLLGSTLQKVINAARCPVLVIPQKPKEK